jgi:hypothetical protein
MIKWIELNIIIKITVTFPKEFKLFKASSSIFSSFSSIFNDF